MSAHKPIRLSRTVKLAAATTLALVLIAGTALAATITTGNGSATIVIPREQAEEKNRLNETLSEILTLLDQSHVDLRAGKTNDANLERLFLQMTGSRLRD